MRSATSTPRPLPRQRNTAEKRGAWAPLRAVPAHASNVEGQTSGLTPANPIQTMDVDPLSRTDNSRGLAPATAIQRNESESNSRLAALARIDALRVEIRALVEVVSLGAEIEVLDLVRDELGSYSRHKAAQEVRSWAGAAGIQLETGLMMLDRAVRSASI